jgi:integrase
LTRRSWTWCCGWRGRTPDVDLEVGRLEVVQTLQRVDGALTFVQSKTRRSERTIPLPGVAVTALREHRARQAAERLALGPDWTDSGLVFTSRIGTPLEPDNLRRSWHQVRAALDQPIRLHDLRHTRVTLLLEAGVPPHIVQEIAGLSALDVTMKHLRPRLPRREARRYASAQREARVSGEFPTKMVRWRACRSTTGIPGEGSRMWRR